MAGPEVGPGGREPSVGQGAAPVDADLLRRVFAVGRGVLSELDPEVVLERVLTTAREITGARYAALGVLDASRTELERFVVQGLGAGEQQAIGELPRGRGVLGELITSASALRLADVARHPRSFGFPAGHPPMRSFLGVPIVVRGVAWGNLYLTEKDGGEFGPADEEVVLLLADWAGIAIEHARLHESEQQRSTDLERAVRGLEAAHEIAMAIGSETDLGRVLELIAKRGRALASARGLLILLREGDDLVVVAATGEVENATGRRIPIEGSAAGDVLRSGRPERLLDMHARLRIAAELIGLKDARAGLIVPLVYRNDGLGVLIAFDHGTDPAFGSEDEQVLLAFATSAATAVATTQSVAADRLRDVLAAAEGERRRWARELHDQTLQSLAAMRIWLAHVRRVDTLVSWQRAGDEVIGELDREIANLRRIVNDLRPSVLDDLGLAAALDVLAHRLSDDGPQVRCTFSPPKPEFGGELDMTVYRLVQEALTNVGKHAHAQRVSVTVTVARGEISVTIEDDGVGFDAAQPTWGFGLVGMRERVLLAQGRLTVESNDAGTTVRAIIPLPTASAAQAAS